MEAIVPLLLAAVIGFTHALEADHLVAVSSIVTKRNNVLLAMKDGIYWGLGHTSTIFAVGVVFMLGRFVLNEGDFRYFEAGVGAMLIVLGISRLYRWATGKEKHVNPADHSHQHGLAYGVGAVHGLAGSGALLVSVLTQIENNFTAIAYLLIFGIGSIVGMMLVAGAFSVPFSVRLTEAKWVRTGLTLLSSVLCIGLGIMVLHENLAA